MWIDEYQDEGYSWHIFQSFDRYWCFERHMGTKTSNLRVVVSTRVISHGSVVSKFAIEDPDTVAEQRWHDIPNHEADRMWAAMLEHPESYAVRAALN